MYNVLWATLLAAAVGLVVNTVVAGVLSQTTKFAWRDIWSRLNIVMTMAGFISILGYSFGFSWYLTAVVCGLIIWATGILRTHKWIVLAVVPVALASFLVGLSAATGNVVQTELLALFGIVGALTGALVCGVLYQLTKRPEQS